jgi:autotransporter-associated beta strand protein
MRIIKLITVALIAFAFAAQDAVVAQTWTGAGGMAWTQPDSNDFDSVYSSGSTATFTNTGAGMVTIDAGGVTPGAVIVNSSANYTFTGGSIGGTGSLTKMGSGTLTITNANSFSGGVFINGGILNLPSGATSANLGDPGNVVTFTGTSSLTFGSGTTLSQGFVINTNVTGTLQVGNANVTINNSLAGSGNLTAINGGTSGGIFSFTSTNNPFSGNIKIYSSSAGSYYAAVTMNSLDDTPGSRITLGNGNSTVHFNYGAGAVVPLVLSNRQIENNAAAEFGPSLNNNATNVNCTVTVNTALIVTGGSKPFTLGGSNSGNNTFAGVITNVTRLTKAGTGNWILTGTNTYTGTNTIGGGTLMINTLKNYGVACSLGAPTSGDIIFNRTTVGNLIYVGSGDTANRTIRLEDDVSNRNSGSGIYNNGTGALIFNGSTFNTPFVSSGNTGHTPTLILGGTFAGSANEIRGVIADNQLASNSRFAITKDGPCTWVLAGTNTYTGSTDVNAGTLRLQSGATTITQTLGALRNQLADGTLNSDKSGAGDLSTTFTNGYSRAAGATGNIVSTGGINGTDNSVNITGAAGFINAGLFFGGSDFAARHATDGYVRAIAYGSDTNAAAVNTITGSNHVKLNTSPGSNQNSTTLLSLNLQGDGVNWTNNSGQTLTSPGILKSGGGSSTISGGNVSGGSNAELVISTDTASDSLTISSVLNQGSGVLTKSGAGTLTLSGTNTYTGQTHVNAGTLSIGANVHLGAQATGATLNLKGGTLQATGTFGLFNGTAGTNNRAVTLLNQSTIEVTGANTLTIAGVISNNGSAGASAPGFNKTGTGTLVLSGSNTYTGPTIITAGTLGLVISDSSTSKSFNGLALNGGALELKYTVAPSTNVPAIKVYGDLTFGGSAGISVILDKSLIAAGVEYPLMTVTGTAPTNAPTLGGFDGGLKWGGPDNKTLLLTTVSAGTLIMIN